MSAEIKVMVINATGSQKDVATLYPQSGVLKIGNEYSHICQEKQMNKRIVLFIEPEVVEAPTPRSDEGSEKKSKRKSKA